MGVGVGVGVGDFLGHDVWPCDCGSRAAASKLEMAAAGAFWLLQTSQDM